MKKIITLLFMLVVLISLNNKSFAQANSVLLNGTTFFTNIESAYAAITPGFVTPQLVEILPAYDGSLELFPISLNLIAGTSTITIRPAAGNNGEVVSSTTTNNYLFRLEGCNNVIIDGRPGGVTSTPSNYLSVNNGFNTAANGNAGTVSFNGADNCIYQYINATAAPGTLTITGARTINIAGAAGNPSNNNIIQNCVVKGGLRGIQNFGLDAANINQNAIIRNNDISQYFNIGMLISNDNNSLIQSNKVYFTSAITTIATFLVGIQVQGTNTTIDQNEVTGFQSLNAASHLHFSNFGINNTFTRNKIHSNVSSSATVNVVVGIQFSGSGTTVFTENEIYNLSAVATGSSIYGMNIASNGTATDNLNIVKNKIYNLSTTVNSAIYGMVVLPRTGNTVNIINNNVSISNPNNSSIGVFGIYSTFAATSVDYTENIRNNSVYIGGVNLGTVGTFINSAGIVRDNNGPLSVYNQFHNNVVNERTTGDANFQFHLGFWLDTLTGTLSLDSNNYYASDPNGGFAALWYDSLFENSDIIAYRGYASPNEQATTFGNVNFLKLTMNFEACPDKSPVTVELRNATSPYALVETASGIAGGAFANVISFANASEGVPYYVVVKSVNMIETWSATTVTFSGSGATYDFTSSLAAAYGSNQKLSGGIPSVYQGDVNQDGIVDLTDLTLTYNDASTFQTSPATDFDCNGVTDLSDIVLVFNNANNFVAKVTPPVFDNQVSVNTESSKIKVTTERVRPVVTPDFNRNINNQTNSTGTLER